MTLTGGKTFDEYKTMRDEEVRVVIADWPAAKLLIAFQYLRARGLSMESISSKIDAALRLEMKEGTGGL